MKIKKKKIINKFVLYDILLKTNYMITSSVAIYVFIHIFREQTNKQTNKIRFRHIPSLEKKPQRP